MILTHTLDGDTIRVYAPNYEVTISKDGTEVEDEKAKGLLLLYDFVKEQTPKKEE